MKMLRGMILAAGIIGLMLGTASNRLFAADPERYAYVDVGKVFDEYQKTKDNDRLLQQDGKKKEQERDAIVTEIRQMKDELALLNDEARQKKQDKLEAKVRELQDFDQQAKKELGDKRAEVVKEIFKDIDDTVQHIGQANGMDYIFNDRALIYHNPKYDMTRQVLDELNKDFGTRKQKPGGKKK